MARDDLILDRYEPVGTAGAGGFGTVTIAWDPRIQRKVAIKTIKLTAHDALRASLPGAQAVAQPATVDRWHGVLPWEDLPDADAQASTADTAQGGTAFQLEEAAPAASSDDAWQHAPGIEDSNDKASAPADDAGAQASQVKTLAHLPGLDEARTAAMLADPRIVTVYDFEVRGRIAYLIMEYVEGLTLTRILADYPDYLTLHMVAAVFSSVAGALVAAHEAGVLHLDIKPDNILVNRAGQVKVTDFGLATLADASGAGTTGGGTIGYMPLEQMRRQHLDARADEWALASVTYEMLTGANPFRVRGLENAEVAIEDAELVLPSLCWENLDEQADDVVFYALDPDRDERYANVADFAEEMEKFLGDADRGSEQLSLVVCDALDPLEEDESADEAYDDYGEWDEEDGWSLRDKLARHSGVVGRLGRVLAGAITADEMAEDDAETSWDDEAVEEPDDEPAAHGKRRMPRPNLAALSTRMDRRVLGAILRLIAAVSGAFITWLALSNMQLLSATLGGSAPYAVASAAAAVGALSAVRADIGALVAYAVLGLAIILCGHPVLGALLLVASVTWWYAAGSAEKALGWVALAATPFGAVGGAGAVPLLAGVASGPLRAGLTTAYCAIVAFALAAMGTKSLLGWDAFAFWSFMRADMAANALAMAQSPDMWTTAAGWIVATLLLSALASRQGNVTFVLGAVMALICVIAGGLAFSTPSMQLVLPPVLSCLFVLALNAARSS